MYSRVHTGSETIVPYLNTLIQKKICLIDYERIKDDKDQLIMGSSKLAGVVGIFDMFRILGEFLLLRKHMNMPFLYSNGSAYMHKDLASCESSLKEIGHMIEKEGIPQEISPFVIGIAGRGIVAQGAIELLNKCLPIETVKPD